MRLTRKERWGLVFFIVTGRRVDAGALERLNAFASLHGTDSYRLPRNTDTLTLDRRSWSMPPGLACGDDTLVPDACGDAITWQPV